MFPEKNEAFNLNSLLAPSTASPAPRPSPTPPPSAAAASVRPAASTGQGILAATVATLNSFESDIFFNQRSLSKIKHHVKIALLT